MLDVKRANKVEWSKNAIVKRSVNDDLIIGKFAKK